MNTRWTFGTARYEAALAAFVARALAPQRRFLQSFRAFEAIVVADATEISLAQIVLKLTVPGVPDIYQGAELWEQSMVDPDNRRPVDFQHRADLLEGLFGPGDPRPAHGSAGRSDPERRTRHRSRAASALGGAGADQARADFAGGLRHRPMERKFRCEVDVRGDECRLRRGREAELRPTDRRDHGLHAGDVCRNPAPDWADRGAPDRAAAHWHSGPPPNGRHGPAGSSSCSC